MHVVYAFYANQKFLGHYCPAYNCVQNPLVYLVWSKVDCQNAKHLGVLARFAHNSSCLYLIVNVLLNKQFI